MQGGEGSGPERDLVEIDMHDRHTHGRTCTHARTRTHAHIFTRVEAPNQPMPLQAKDVAWDQYDVNSDDVGSMIP